MSSPARSRTWTSSSGSPGSTRSTSDAGRRTCRSREMTALDEQLLSLGYVGLFRRLEPGFEEIWAAGDAGQRLRAIALDPAGDDDVRLLAAEVLFRKDPDFPPPAAGASLAELYARALRATTVGNEWGLPGRFDGALAQHVRRLGPAAAGPLEPLLDDDRAVPYAGSEEATEGGRMHIRVKDLAASLVAPLRDLPWRPARDPAVRDAEIDALKARL